jgi:hypothetical protein
MDFFWLKEHCFTYLETIFPTCFSKVNSPNGKYLPDFEGHTNKGVCHTVALPIYIQKCFKAKRRILKTQIFHHAKI